MSQRQIQRGAWGLTVVIMVAVLAVVAWRAQEPGLAGKGEPKDKAKSRPAPAPPAN